MEDCGWGRLGFSRASVGVRPTHNQSQPKIELKNKFDALGEDGPAVATRLGEFASLDQRSLGCRTPIPDDDFFRAIPIIPNNIGHFALSVQERKGRHQLRA